MMTDFSNQALQLKEILRIIASQQGKKFSKTKRDDNLALLIEPSDDEYLANRAKFMQQTIANDANFYELLGYLEPTNPIEYNAIKKYFNHFCNKARKQKDNALSFIDLFCGSGGFSLGFLQEGFSAKYACDFEPACIDTYRFNHMDMPSNDIVCEDVRTIKDDLIERFKNIELDLVIGGPPCQGFSIANQQKIIDDPRNQLYKSFVEIVEALQPKFFVMENVKGMSKVADQVKETFLSIGYSVEFQLLKAQDYGVPQNRERLIFIGNRIGIDNQLIFDAINKNKVTQQATLRQAIEDLKPLEASRLKNKTDIITAENGGVVTSAQPTTANAYIQQINPTPTPSLVVFNHQARYNNDRDIEIFGRLNEGDDSSNEKIADIMPYKSRSHIFKDKYFKLIYDTKCKAITAHMKFDCNMYIHPTQARGLTPREGARVQSYPDDYVFQGSYTKTYMQIGNSVPPILGRVIAKEIKPYLK